MTDKICPKCGRRYKKKFNFCEDCGIKLDVEKAPKKPKPKKKPGPKISQGTEKKISKKRILGMFKKKEKMPRFSVEEIKKMTTKGEKTSIEEIVMGIEKINGKLELIDSFRNASEERFIKLGEEIGELRSSMLEQESVMGKVSAGFERIEEMMKDIEPERTEKEKLKTRKLIDENTARIDMINKKLTSFSDELKKYRSMMERIKGVENLVKLIKDAQNITSKIKESENNMRRLSSKVEKIFSEFDTRMTKIDKQNERLDRLEGLVNEVVGSLDALEIRLKSAVFQNDLTKFRETVKKDYTDFETRFEDRLHELKNVVDMLVSAMEDVKGEKVVLEEKKPTKKTKEKREELSVPNLDIDVGKGELDMSEETKPSDDYHEIRNLIEKCHESIDKGDLHTANDIYTKIVELYKKMREESGATDEVQEIYEDIMELHSELVDLSSS